MPIGLPRRHHDGGTLLGRLLILVLIPLLGMTAFAAIGVQARLSSATHARRVEQLVASIGRVAEVQDALLTELTPSMVFAALQSPSLTKALGLTEQTRSQLGVDATLIATLRATTDRAVAELADDSRMATLATATHTTITEMRRDIDSVTALPTGYREATALVRRLTSARADLVTVAFDQGVGTATAFALRDLSHTTTFETYAELEIAELAGAAYPDLFPGGDSTSAVQDWLRDWGGLNAARRELLADGAPPLVHALNEALDSTAARTIDTYAARAAIQPGPMPATEMVRLFTSSQQRDARLDEVLEVALDRVYATAASQRTNADLALWTIIAIAVGLSVASALAGWRILRSVSRPLHTLADSAREVSEGVLAEVRIDGPREVRTAARGLAAAVASLRKVEAQAAAVSAGDLNSDVVRHALPGPLGQVVHASVETIIGAIHERDAAQADLAYQSAHDALTKLTNRTQAMSLIDKALQRARRRRTVTALMLVDLDRFKTVNDTLGHDVGDAVLVTCAQRMTGVVRSGDAVARLGGDEFVILLEDVTSGVDVAGLAQRVVDTLTEPIQLSHRQLHVGASVGVAVCVDAHVDAGRLLTEAAAAARQAKEDGRGRFSIFDEQLREELAKCLEMERQIAAALANDEFVLYYQPVVDLRTGRSEGVEALIRWNRPGHGTVPPSEFIPVAEASTLINDIGRWTLVEATAQLARWDAELGDRRLTMAVNISGRHLSSDTLLDDVRQALDASGIDPQRLVVELTETVLVEHLTATGKLGKLRELGVQVAIDDFGTGFTSIGQLLRLPIDTLKIDRSFVASHDPTHHELVHLMTRAAHAFGLHVIAEGVEHPEQLTSLTDCAIDSAQGYLYARPQAAADALALIQAPSLPVPLVAAQLPTRTR